MVTRILTLVDGSSYTGSVCGHAAWAADRLDATIELVMVLGRREAPALSGDYSGSLGPDGGAALLEELTALDEQRGRLLKQRGRAILGRARANLEEAGTKVEVALRHGDLLETVAELEQRADMIVIGKRGDAADFARLHLGSNLERVVRSAHRPILVASRAFRPIRRVMVAFDGGASAIKAVELVRSSPLFAGLGCVLFTAGTAEGDLGARLKQAEADLRAAGREVLVDLVPGEPAELIAARAQEDDVDLLVMGAYGHSRIRSFLVGSTTSEMIRRSLLPVLLIR